MECNIKLHYMVLFGKKGVNDEKAYCYCIFID